MIQITIGAPRAPARTEAANKESVVTPAFKNIDVVTTLNVKITVTI